MNKKNKLILGGDWAPQKRKVANLPIKNTLIFNLEGPILSDGMYLKKPIKKAGPTIFNTSLPELSGHSVAILANNHFFDYGYTGYISSINKIEKSDCLAVGAGKTKFFSSMPIIINLNEKKIGILARCERQFGAAQELIPGVAIFDSTIYEKIKNLKEQVDIVIVSMHAAAEMLPWPSPARQDTFRSLIDAGADIIHGHHSHVPQGWEEYNGGLIFYGLGNFCVDPAVWSWHPNGLWSLTPEIILENAKVTFNPKTMVIEDHGKHILVKDADNTQKSVHQSYLAICNQPLTDRLLLEGIWQEAAVIMYNAFYAEWLGFNGLKPNHAYHLVKKYFKNLKSKFRKHKKVNSDDENKKLLNYHLFSCDAHNDAIATALGVLSGELDDCRTKETKKLVDKWMIDN